MLALFLVAGQALVLTSYSDYSYADISFEMEMEMDYGGYGGWEIDTFSQESNYAEGDPHQPLLIMFGNLQTPLMIISRMKVQQLVSEARVPPLSRLNS